jgi:hypothetical protein
MDLNDSCLSYRASRCLRTHEVMRAKNSSHLASQAWGYFRLLSLNSLMSKVAPLLIAKR